MQTKQPRWVQTLLLYFLLTNSVPGIWALFMPDAFYNYFPGFGHTWVSVDGPYNEHLIRDVGAFFMALTTLSLVALLQPGLVDARVVAVCLLVFNVPHLWYHLQHLHMLLFVDQVGNVVVLSAAVLLGIPLLFYRSSSTVR
ncbi:hypothetical protein IC229_07105 [Spirosoma sp. BT702]|uniref:Uncharacterized protein n=1 Tax=Spirosoma profusum TaxID=2771354 RepID=A0A927ARY0_9BACT|nr:hypothetical protein [Spirosoma profusum]MBD2700395.1 hypothetical protein [Spirosoma profusum]